MNYQSMRRYCSALGKLFFHISYDRFNQWVKKFRNLLLDLAENDVDRNWDKIPFSRLVDVPYVVRALVHQLFQFRIILRQSYLNVSVERDLGVLIIGRRDVLRPQARL